MRLDIPQCKERQDLIIAWDKKELKMTEQEYNDRLNTLNDEIRKEINVILNKDVKEKFQEIKTIKSRPRYKIYKDIVELHRKSKELCEEIKKFKKQFHEELKK